MATFLRSWPNWRRQWRIEAVHHAVDAQRFAYRPRPLEIDQPFNMTVISHAAPHKDFDVVVKALAALRKSGLDVTARFTAGRVGNPAFEQACIDRLVTTARRIGVLDYVEFLGSQSHVERVYDDSSVVVSPSMTESFGFPVLEAMASGAPVIASAIPASVELLGAGGIYFAPGRADGLVGAILTLGGLKPGDQLAVLDARRRTAEALSWERNAEAIAGLVELATS